MSVSAVLICCIVAFICNSVQWTSADFTDEEGPPYAYNPNDVCTLQDCELTAEEIISKMDKNLDPCKNFYEFACGRFIRETLMLDDEVEVNLDATKKNRIENQIKRLLEEESPPDELNAFKLAKTFYRSCMNEAAIEENGLNPLLNQLKRLGGWPVVEGDYWIEESFTWMEAIHKMKHNNFLNNFLLNFGVDTVYINSTEQQHRFQLTTPTYLPKPKYARLEKYYNLMTQVAVLLGADESRAKDELKKAMAFEIALRSVNYVIVKEMTAAELTEQYPTIPWTKYFAEMLPETVLAGVNVSIACVPDKIAHFERVMSQTPKRVVANYLMFKVALYMLPYLNSEVRQMLQDVKRKLNPDLNINVTRPRWLVCSHNVLRSMPLSVTGLYARAYLADHIPSKVYQLAEEVRNQFRILLDAEWIDNSTRTHMVNKLNAMRFQTMFLDEAWENDTLEDCYRGLIIDENDYWQSQSNIYALTGKHFNNFQLPVEKNIYLLVDKTITFFNSYYRAVKNELHIPFGAIHARLYLTHGVPSYLDYGNLAVIIGREMTHGFDVTGRHFDENGNYGKWWSAGFTQKFYEKISCLIHQYDQYIVKQVGLKVNGRLTANENIADIVGIKLAYMAYQNRLIHEGSQPGLPGLPYDSNQIFWITAASSFCSLTRDNTLIHEIHTDRRAPPEFRVIGSFSNIPEFAKDFNCPPDPNINSCGPFF